MKQELIDIKATWEKISFTCNILDVSTRKAVNQDDKLTIGESERS